MLQDLQNLRLLQRSEVAFISLENRLHIRVINVQGTQTCVRAFQNQIWSQILN